MTAGFSELSEAEQQLVEDFVRKSSDTGDRQAEEPILTGDAVDYATAQAAFKQVASLVSKDVEPITLRWLTLKQLETEIKSKAGAIMHPPDDMPADATITREKLNKLLIKDEVINYFLMAGAMIEQFTIELAMAEIVDEGRQSNSQRSRIEQMGEAEREELLYTTGIIDSEEKGQIRRAYGLRNQLAHSPGASSVIEALGNVESDIERTHETLDMLHEKVYGIPLDYRISHLLVDDE